MAAANPVAHSGREPVLRHILMVEHDTFTLSAAPRSSDFSIRFLAVEIVLWRAIDFNAVLVLPGI